MLKALEGSQAIAQTVALCRPQVVAAYPITPQTHIVENIARLVADGSMECELVSVESEFSAASLVLGAACAGSRTYTASASQGILLMSEVLYNIAGPCGSCMSCDNCWTLCPDSAVLMATDPAYTKSHYVFDYDYCKGCGLCAHECPTGFIRMQTEP